MSEKKIELHLLALVELGPSPPHKGQGKQTLPHHSFSYSSEIKVSQPTWVQL